MASTAAPPRLALAEWNANEVASNLAVARCRFKSCSRTCHQRHPTSADKTTTRGVPTCCTRASHLPQTLCHAVAAGGLCLHPEHGCFRSCALDLPAPSHALREATRTIAHCLTLNRGPAVVHAPPTADLRKFALQPAGRAKLDQRAAAPRSPARAARAQPRRSCLQLHRGRGAFRAGRPAAPEAREVRTA